MPFCYRGYLLRASRMVRLIGQMTCARFAAFRYQGEQFMKKHVFGILGAAMFFGLVAVTPARAHHAFTAEFDANKPLKLKGTVTEMEWINPHAWLHINVKTPDGKVESWMVEAGTPNVLYRRGFTKNALAVGAE